MAWYAIRVQSNKEDHVKRTLERKIETHGLQELVHQVLVPTEKVVEIKGGKKRTRKVKTYPGYVLVDLEMCDDAWIFIRETPGVGDFVGGHAATNQKPFPLTEDEVAKIFGAEEGAEEEKPAAIRIDFEIGERVKIKDGPFEDFDGSVDEIIAEKGLIRVTVNIFGRSTPVELEYWQAERI